jgi:ATP-dependent protease ClpP protease subunit
MTAQWLNNDVLKGDWKEDPIFRLHTYNIDVQNNHIYLFPWNELAGTEPYGDGEPGVDYTMANRFIMNARICMMAHPGKPMTVHMKTCGGDWSEGMAIFDMLINYPHETTILNYTHARSMSSIIFQSATKRVMMPHSTFMFHDGIYGDFGTMKQVRAGLVFHEAQGAVMLDIYAYRMKQRGKFKTWSIDRIKEMLRTEMDKKEDVYLDAKTTIEWGLADEIFNGDWSSLPKYTPDDIKRSNAYAEHFISG